MLDFEIARLATATQLAARYELLALAHDERELEHLLQDNARTADRVLGELLEGARLFTQALTCGREHHKTADLGDKVVSGLVKVENATVRTAVLSRAGKTIQRRDFRRRAEVLNAFEQAAETPLRLAQRDVLPSTPPVVVIQ